MRWGVLSTARIARKTVIPAIGAAANAELVAIASRDGERSEKVGQEFGIPRRYGSYEALLSDAEVDAVYAPLPNALHGRWTIAAAEAGKHVLCEKPLAPTAAECERMRAAALSHGVGLMEGFMYRFHPRTERLIEMVRGGAVGAVHSIHSTFTFPLTRPADVRWSPDLGGGSLLDVGCYCVNVSRTLAGGEPLEAQAWQSTARCGVDERLHGSLRFAGGVVAQFDCGFTTDRRQWVEVAGSEASLVMASAFRPGAGDREIFEHRGLETRRHAIDGDDEFRRMFEHFGDAVATGRPFRYGLDDAVANLRAIEALLASARCGGQPVAVADR
jgi:predicted dehydrogenase